LLLQLQASPWSLFGFLLDLLGALSPLTFCSRGHCFLFLLPILAWCYPCHYFCDHVPDAHPSPQVALLAAIPVLLCILHSCHNCQPLCLLTSCPGFHQDCKMSNFSVRLHQFLCLLGNPPLAAAPPVAGGQLGFSSSSPFSVHESLHWLIHGLACNLCSSVSNGCGPSLRVNVWLET
jgi:hypothetical protein